MVPVPAVEFLERHLPARAPEWEIAALEALTGLPRSVLPWPWIDLRLIPEPDMPQPQSILRIEADLGTLVLPAHAAAIMHFRVCVALAWTGMLLPEREAYSLIVEGFGVTGRGAPDVANPQATQKVTRAHMPLLPDTPAPGFRFADVTAPDWDAPLEAGDTIAIAFKNTSDKPLSCRVRGSALVFRTLPT